MMEAGRAITLLLQPRDPIILRDARPFTNDPGARAVTLDWPLPQTIAGALRTHIGTAAAFDWSGNGPERARRIIVQGPFLAARSAGEEAWSIYLPAPRDAFIYPEEPQSERQILALRPCALPDGAGCDLPHRGLRPLRVDTDAKPDRGDAFWSLPSTIAWLQTAQPSTAPEDGLAALPRETRVHVGIDRSTRTAQEGLLFSTVALAFPDSPMAARDSRPERPELAMLCRVEPPGAWQPQAGFLALGGERRLVTVTPLGEREESDPWPSFEPSFAQALSGATRLRLQLSTPAIFARGWLPGWIDPEMLEGEPPGVPGLRLRLVSAAAGRPTPVSGWDLARKPPGPKPVRSAAPAGSVYFFELPAGTLSLEQAQALWLGTVSDAEQDRRDGFGLVLPGIW